MANSESLFSKVFRGFSPDEVIAYIDELNAAHRNAKAESDARINSLANELASATVKAGECTDLKNAVAEKDGEIAAQEAQIERLTADNENQRLAMVAQSEKINELEETVAQLKSALEAATIKSSAMEQNSKEYESMLADVESILASSRRKAEELIAEAERKASMIVESAERDARDKSARIVSESDEHVNDNLKKVKYLYRRQDELAEIFRDHKVKVDSFFASISEFTDKKN